MILELSAVHKVVPVVSSSASERSVLHVLSDISFSVSAGATCAFVGPSGSGKTTLLGLCAGLDLPTQGTIRFEGKDIAQLSDDERALLRRSRMGFVFQNFQLIPNLSAVENVMLPLDLAGISAALSRERATEALAKVGLRERLQHFPAQLSGGEQQRVALARAIVHQPAVLFADEPTGNLDAENAARVIDLLFALNQDSGTALVLVTHNPELAARCQQRLALRGGRLVSHEGR